MSVCIEAQARRFARLVTPLWWKYALVISDLIFVGDATQGRTVTLSHVEQPHGDALTTFRVKILANDLAATCRVESLEGDTGLDVDSAQTAAGVEQQEFLAL